MINAKRAGQKTKEALRKTVSEVDLINLRTIEKNILKACDEGKAYVVIHFSIEQLSDNVFYTLFEAGYKINREIKATSESLIISW